MKEICLARDSESNMYMFTEDDYYFYSNYSKYIALLSSIDIDIICKDTTFKTIYKSFEKNCKIPVSGKDVNEYKNMFEKAYKQKYLNEELGLDEIKHMIIKCIENEYNTLNTIKNKSLNISRDNYEEEKENDFRNVEIACELLINKGYQDEIKYDIEFNSNYLPGIYEIVNIQNNKRYIGRSKNIGYRWNQHKNLLKKGVHHCEKLQKDYDTYGSQSFQFSIIEIIKDKEEQIFKERYWWENTIGEKYNSVKDMCDFSSYRIKILENRVQELENELALVR